MGKRPLVIGFVALLALTGCAGTSEEAATEAPTPTVTTPVNQGPCEDFADLVITIPSRLGNEATAVDNYASLQGAFDNIALTADGVVQERMLDLVENWPDSLDVVVWKRVEDLNTHFDSVERACAADGVDREIGQLTAS